jgi:hypothetical protein
MPTFAEAAHQRFEQAEIGEDLRQFTVPYSDV